ncbi:MAG: pseudaminic acid cytidylyltransferase [Lachnospiraceae bacterium]|nr:pseudaminic acid cytidylyltransferase [Lachnospiraceae bacterium]
MRGLAVITARGGSKRIPRKNIKEFCGKPILAYSIEAAIRSKAFDTVMVSTDDEEIAEIAIRYGAEVPFYRSAQTSNDFATTNDVLLEVIEEYEKRGEQFDYLCCIYPTAPFLTSERLTEGKKLLLDSDADTLIPVVAFSYPPQRALHEVNGYLEPVHPEYLDSRSQDLEKHFHDVGQFYVTRVDNFKKNKKLMLGKILPMEILEMEVQDIDNLIDWQMAELKFRILNEKKD